MTELNVGKGEKKKRKGKTEKKTRLHSKTGSEDGSLFFARFYFLVIWEPRIDAWRNCVSQVAFSIVVQVVSHEQRLLTIKEARLTEAIVSEVVK